MSKTITAELRGVAKKLVGKSDKHSEKIYRLAQGIEDVQNLYNNFDPSQESSISSMMGQPEGANIQPLADNKVDNGGATIPIESFIKPGEPTGPPPNYDVHHCSVTFYAPKDTQESDMMNYILGIGEKLGVEVKKFEWEKQDPKQKTSK
jgi:hypothetical protein